VCSSDLSLPPRSLSNRPLADKRDETHSTSELVTRVGF